MSTISGMSVTAARICLLVAYRREAAESTKLLSSIAQSMIPVSAKKLFMAASVGVPPVN
jgi:hypothetical protein